MPIRIYDTMSRGVVPLDTGTPGHIGMYVCGPTVYNHIHIGNARTMLWMDMIRRYLEYRGFDVTYVMNYTDVDDKIIERSQLESLEPHAIAAKYESAFDEVIDRLGGRRPDILARATEHIGEMVEAIIGLVDSGSAYEAEGNVWFSIESFARYGKLAHRTIDDMRAGERVEPHESKRHPLDFSLWKAAKEGEPAWPSPWGQGRPGWHIECSVMSTRYLGMPFDLHGGGSDLIFPHHQNEIAQAEALARSEPFVRHWVHAGMVQMESEKMSKSLGNFVLAKDIVERFAPEAIRYWALMGSYRSQVLFSEASLTDAANAYERWRTFNEAARHAGASEEGAESERALEATDLPRFVQRFCDAMDDDFNSAEAFAAVHDLVRQGNRLIERAQRGEAAARGELDGLFAQFAELTSLLGFRFTSQAESPKLVAGLVEFLLELREEARGAKDFARADSIRDRLTDFGVTIEDTPAGARWRVAGDAG